MREIWGAQKFKMYIQEQCTLQCEKYKLTTLHYKISNTDFVWYTYSRYVCDMKLCFNMVNSCFTYFIAYSHQYKVFFFFTLNYYRQLAAGGETETDIVMF